MPRRVNRATVLAMVSQSAAGEIRNKLDIGEKEIAVVANGVCVAATTSPIQLGRTTPIFIAGESRFKLEWLMGMRIFTRRFVVLEMVHSWLW